MFRKLRKLNRDPIGYFLDSKHAFLRSLGQGLYGRQKKRFEKIGAINADRTISVIMTAYNTGYLIEDAVRSVLAQTHKNLQLLVIDDASTDDTLDVLKAIAATDRRMRVFSSPTNHGTYWSKNWCLQNTDSDFVTFHDSDDTSHPKRLQTQLGAILSSGSVGATCRWNRIDSEGGILVIDGLEERTAAISLMIRRADVVNKIGYFDSVRISADTEYLRRIHKVFGVKKLFPMRQVLYTGLLRDDSLTRQNGGGFVWEVKGNSYTRTLSGDREVYHDTFLLWQEEQLKNNASLMIDFPMAERKFKAPDGICRNCNDLDTQQVQEVALEKGLRA